MPRQITVAMIVSLVAVVLALLLSCEKSVPRGASHGALRGTEMLLELRKLDPKREGYPDGVYAMDPLAKRPRPQLLIRGARHPMWRPTRDGFFYLVGCEMRFASRSGRTRHVGFAGRDPAEPWQWLTGGGYWWAGSNWSTGTITVWWDSSRLTARDALPPGQAFVYASPPGRSQLRVPWRSVFTIKSLDSSPDGLRMALEISPHAPADLLRTRSKIYIRRLVPGRARDFYGNRIPADRGALSGCRRLTQLGPEVCEMNPRWSPKGDWIAFTVVRFDLDYVAAPVCRPDGTDYTEFACPSELGGPPGGWARNTPPRPKPAQLAPAFADWGDPHTRTAGWSHDGRYLILDSGDGAQVVRIGLAELRDRRWWVRHDAALLPAGGRVVFGRGRKRASLLAFADGARVAILDVRSRSLLPASPREAARVPSDVSIEWLDW